MFKCTLLFLSVLFIVTTRAQSKNTALPTDLYACWKASYEENDEKTNTRIFRSCAYPAFPPSLYRLEINFFVDGKCKYLHVGASDQHYYVDGKWLHNNVTGLISVNDDKGKTIYKFYLKEVSKDILKIRSVN